MLFPLLPVGEAPAHETEGARLALQVPRRLPGGLPARHHGGVPQEQDQEEGLGVGPGQEHGQPLGPLIISISGQCNTEKHRASILNLSTDCE